MTTLNKLEAIRDYVIPPLAPAVQDWISAQEVFNLYGAIFPKYRGKIYLSDAWYKITTISELRRFIRWSTVDKYPYIEEIRDCDDAAIALTGQFAMYPGWSGFPTSLIWGSLYGGHAFFTAIAWPSLEDRTPTPYHIEPQNDLEIAEESVEDMELWLLVV